MKLRWSGFSLLFLSIVFILSCDSDEEKTVCRLSSVASPHGTHEYKYNAENKIEMILFHGDGQEAKINLEYNDEGILENVVAFDVSSPEEIEKHELIHDGHNKPQEVRTWNAGDDLSGPPYRVTTFFHDGNGRLLKKETYYPKSGLQGEPQRFEYDDRNNVKKIFLGEEATEFLWLENLSFDNKSKYYSQTPELLTLNVYVYLYQPGDSNPLTARVYPSGPQPVNVTYTTAYDQNGLITSYHASKLYYGSSPDFDEVTYNCSF